MMHSQSSAKLLEPLWKGELVGRWQLHNTCAMENGGREERRRARGRANGTTKGERERRAAERNGKGRRRRREE